MRVGCSAGARVALSLDMTSRTLVVALLAALAACGSSPPHRAASHAAPPAASAPPPASARADALPLWPRVKRGVLPNGLTYYILKHGKPANRAFLWLAVNAGSVQEDDDQRGLAHLTEHMAFNGTRRFPEAEIIKYLESIGMRFGADLNASTSFDETIYKLEVPTDAPQFIPKGLDILRDWAGDVSFDPRELDKERGVVLEEWRLGRGAGQRLFDKQVKVLFEGSRYADRVPIGLPETIKSASRDVAVRYFNDWYRPDLMAVIAVGDFTDPAAVEREIITRFSDLRARGSVRPRPAAGVPVATGTRVSIETDREMPAHIVSVYNILAHRPEATERDFRRALAEQLYQAILNERLEAIGRRKDAPYSAAIAGVQTLTREIDGFVRTAQAKAGKTEDALRSLFAEVLRVEAHGFAASELERARTNLLRTYEQYETEESTSDSAEFTDEITRNFFESEFMIGRAAERAWAIKLAPTITLQELNALAHSFGGADNRAILVAGPDGAKLPSRARVLAIIDEVTKSVPTIEPWQDVAVSTPLMAQAPRPGRIVAERTIPSIGVTDWKLSNGARVIVKPTDFEADAVTISGSSPGGLAVATAQQFATARLASELVGIGGVADLDAEAVDKLLAGKRVSVSTGLGETTEGIDANGSARDIDTMLQLVYLQMTAPRKDERVIAVWKQNTEEQLENRLRVPEVQFALQSQDVLYRGHPRRRPPTPAEVAKADPDRAIAFYKQRFGDATDFTFVIVGAVDLAKLRPLVELYLASLPARGRREKELDTKVRKVAGVVKKSWQLGQEPKARVSMMFHGAERWSRDKERDLYVLGQVLSIRLREVLREDLGGVYGVSAGGSFSRGPYPERQFSIQFGCAPDAVDKLIAAAQAEIAKIADVGIDATYLEKVKAAFTRERETSLRTNGLWVNWLETTARYGDDPTLILDPAPLIARMTTEHVKAAAKHYLDAKQYYQAVMIPAAQPPTPGAAAAGQPTAGSAAGPTAKVPAANTAPPQAPAPAAGPARATPATPDVPPRRPDAIPPDARRSTSRTKSAPAPAPVPAPQTPVPAQTR